MKTINELFFTYWGYLIYPLLALFVSVLLTRLCTGLLPRLGYVDKPGGRHIHERQVPRGGGIAVITAFFLTLGYYALTTPEKEPQELFLRLLLPALLLGILGMIDDRRELSSKLKLAVQILVAVIVWSGGDRHYTIFGWTVPWFLSLVLVIIWVIIILNAFNLIDGLDGLASGLAIVSAGCMAIWFLLAGGRGPQAMSMLILAGACLGFLRYNFHPARIFLGDTGSTFLGLIFAITGLSTLDRAVTASSLLLPLLAIGVPLFDVILAIWRRSVRKLLDPKAGGIMDGDQDHLHHRLLRETRKQTTTAFLMYLIGCGFAAAALLLLYLRHSTLTLGYILLLFGVLIAIRQLAGVELYASARLIRNGLVRPRRGLLINLVHPFIDFFLIGGAYMAASWTTCGTAGTPQMFMCTFGPVALLLCLSGTYRVYWLRAGINDYCRLKVLLIIGTILASSLLFILEYRDMEQLYGIGLRQFISGAIIFSVLTVLLIVGERLLIHYAEWFWFRKLDLQHQGPDRQRLLVYGGGLKCSIFISTLYCAQKSGDTGQIIGIVDDDPVLAGLRVYGFPVFGNSAQLEEIYARQPFDKLLIATRTDDAEKMCQLKDFCARHKVIMSRLVIDEEAVAEENDTGAEENP